MGTREPLLLLQVFFLQMNGYRLMNYHEDEITFALEVANQKMRIDSITMWLKQHSEPI